MKHLIILTVILLVGCAPLTESNYYYTTKCINGKIYKKRKGEDFWARWSNSPCFPDDKETK